MNGSHSIHADVREIELDMKNNIKGLVLNIDDANKLKQTSDNIKEGANTYKKTASEVKTVTCWQKWKLIIIIVIIVVVVAIIIPIAVVKS
jgi:ABC-type lipoprotein release transport system permease subunit